MAVTSVKEGELILIFWKFYDDYLLYLAIKTRENFEIIIYLQRPRAYAQRSSVRSLAVGPGRSDAESSLSHRLNVPQHLQHEPQKEEAIAGLNFSFTHLPRSRRWSLYWGAFSEHESSWSLRSSETLVSPMHAAILEAAAKLGFNAASWPGPRPVFGAGYHSKVPHSHHIYWVKQDFCLSQFWWGYHGHVRKVLPNIPAVCAL